MADEFEKLIANKSTLAEVHDVITKNPSLKHELLDSMFQPIVLLSKRFMALKIKEERVNVSEPATDEEISTTFEKIHTIDQDILADKLTKEDLKYSIALHEFMKKHCRRSPYVFQVWMQNVFTVQNIPSKSHLSSSLHYTICHYHCWTI